jgi:hypothetical protein
MVTDANTLLNIPEVIDNKSYDVMLDADGLPLEPSFLERAEFLHSKGFYKEMTIQELREKLRSVYRKKIDSLPQEPEDVWK